MKNIFEIEIDSKRVFGLDLLRALAILFVVMEHGELLVPSGIIRKINHFFVFDGVTIFFVLSGFLIGGILIRTIEKNGINKNVLLTFWIRRWFRTLPNYFLILIILCILNLFFSHGFNYSHLYKYFFFLQNLFERQGDFFPESWSLAVEEWFYLLIPLFISIFIIMLKSKPRQGILLTAITIILLTTLFRYYRFSSISINSINEWDSIFNKQVITRLDSLMFGVIGAYTQFYCSRLWLKYKHILLILGIFLFVLSKYIIPKFGEINGIYSIVFSFSLLSIATLSLLPYLSNLKSSNGVFFRSITYLSITSYSMYLIHASIIEGWILSKIPWTALIGNVYVMMVIQYVLYWILSILVSILLYKYYETTMTKLRDKEKFKELICRMFFSTKEIPTLLTYGK